VPRTSVPLPTVGTPRASTTRTDAEAVSAVPPSPPPAGPALCYTVSTTATAGSVAHAIHRRLQNRRSADGARQLPWHPVTVDAGTRRSSAVCCSRLDGVNVFLGDKRAVELLQDEARVVALRRCRASSVGDGGVACAHQRKRARAAAASAAPATQLLSHLPATKAITLKARMVATLCALYSEAVVFSQLTPQTFVLRPRGDAGDHRLQWLQAARRPCDEIAGNAWIVKSSHGKGGAGIKIADCGAGDAAARDRQLRQLLAYVDGCGEPHPWVAQRYVARPLLLGGRKFDIRSWVLVTPRRAIYVYRDGVCRTTSEPYDAADVANSLAHLTNHCLQEQGGNFGRYEAGNELPFDALDRQLLRGIAVHGSGGGARRPMSYAADLHPQIRAIVVNTLAAVPLAGAAAAGVGADAFQLLGYDFIVDERLKVWLLEVNGAPGIAAHLQDDMVDDIIELAIDPLFPGGEGGRDGARDDADDDVDGNGFEFVHRFA
jgi:hypothetical protein